MISAALLLIPGVVFLLLAYRFGKRPPLTPAQYEQGFSLDNRSNSLAAILFGIAGIVFVFMAAFAALQNLYPPPPALR